ncbi:sarcosine oxidase subunit gamma [Massilia putida]|uniref:sarcosine oxidase subunit gamma n=1 Tax=Massilia putida TaxID=1141883 RepID=UPI0009FB89AC|nr:sarcosine oxidase subunit gamma family protein [Massilia putida]
MSNSNLQFADVVEPQARAKVAFAPYAQSPLHDFGLPAKARRPDGSCGVWMNELALLGYVIVRGDAQDPAFVRAVKSVLGIALPTVPGTVTPFANGVALWQAPDEWLLVCARSARQACIAGLEAALADMHAQVVDNSGGLTMVYLTGAQQVTLLRHVGVYDFETLGPGRLASTVCGKATITVFRHDDKGIFLIFRRSFADYIWRLLSKTARPYGLGIAALEHSTAHPVLRLV